MFEEANIQPRIGELYTVQPATISMLSVELDPDKKRWVYTGSNIYNPIPGKDWLLLVEFWVKINWADYFFLFDNKIWIRSFRNRNLSGPTHEKQFAEDFYSLDEWNKRNERCLSKFASNW